MSSKCVTLIATNDQSQLNLENEKILQYLYCQLMNLKFIVKESCNIESNCEYLTKKIQNYLENSFIFLLTSQNELVYEVLSKLFNEKLIASKHLASIYKFNILDNQNVKKISVPHKSKIYQVQNHVNGINPVCIQFKNIFIIPNDFTSVKVIFQNILIPLLRTENNDTFGKKYVLNCNHNGISNMLNDSLCKGDDSVNIERFFSVEETDNNCELNINLISKNFSALVKYENTFKRILANDITMNSTIHKFYWDRMDLMKTEVFVEEALQVIKCCYSEYQPQDVFICFNGGKDCTVLLYLTLYILRTVHPLYKDPILCFYIQSKDPFDEVKNFIDQCRMYYNLELMTINEPIKDGLQNLLLQRPNFTACLMGTRRTDPYCENMSHFAMTDPDWPQIMRVNPILDWKYSNIWTFLLTCKIPYCELYDYGFTSLGGKLNTGPNPALKYVENGMDKYLPAYKLEDETKERDGRRTSK